MIYARLVLFNYRLIVANFLIYDLIATTSAANAATPLPAIFMTHKTDAPLGSVNASNDLLPPSPLPVPLPPLMTMMERAKTTSASSAPSDQTLPAKSVRRLSRPKRYLSFPEGSSFTVCVTVTLVIPLASPHPLIVLCRPSRRVTSLISCTFQCSGCCVLHSRHHWQSLLCLQ